MPASNPGAQQTPRKVRLTAKAKQATTAPPRQADQGDRTRSRPVQETGKVRMYAHPQRPAAQKVFRQQANDDAAAAKATKTRQKAIAKVKVTPVPSPDATDSTRPPAQQAHDRQFTAQVVRDQRVKALREQNRGSGTRAVKAWVKANVSEQKAAETQDVHGHSGSGPFAVIAAHVPVGGLSAKLLANAAKDAAELAVTTPSSVAHLASTAYHHPEQVPGLLAQPYIDFAHAPLKTAEDKPVSTALMLAPAVRVPGRVVGKVTRATGKQTLERPAATLPGTALEEARIGSRDAVVRHAQSRHDAHEPAPTVTVREVHRRVDEAVSAQQKARERLMASGMQGAHEHAKTLPEHEREAYLAEHEQAVREVANRHADEAYAREFGVNSRPSTGAAERVAAKAERETAGERKSQARDSARAAEAHHEEAFTAARRALAQAQRSPKLKALESRRNDAQRDLSRAQTAQVQARAAHGHAKGRAQVLADKVTDPRSAAAANTAVGTLAKRQAAVDAAGQVVKDARAQVRDFDRQIAAERQRITGVPPAEHQALTAAIHARGAAQTELATARAEAGATKAAHITAKDEMRNASLVDPASEGRLFEHKADADLLARKLNETPMTLQRGGFTAAERALPAAREHVPVNFVVRQAGDHYSVLPDFVAERIRKHEAVGSSQAPIAKVLRVSRGMFTRAILPTRPTWLTGQAVEGVIRAGAMRAGPVSYLRARRLVAEMERQHPGSGEALLDRAAPGGRIGRVWKDFGDIGHEPRTLAQEFPDNPIAHALTDLGATPGIKQVHQLYRAVTDAVFTQLNGKFLEGVPQTAMLGAALRDSPLLERSFLRISDQAMADAAEALQNTHAQVELARAVRRAYGKYSAFGPLLREATLHWTPFVPWLLNSARFLTRVLPVDHPILTALLADINVAEQDWREANRLSLQGDHVPQFLMGSVPTHDGADLLHVGHYTPFGAATDPSGGIAGLILPQFAGAYAAIDLGVDWTGKPLKHEDGRPFDDGERWLYGLTQLGESLLPLVSQVSAIAGADDKGAAARKQFHLMSSSPAHGPTISSPRSTPGAYEGGAVGSSYDGGAYSSAYGN